MRPEEVAARRDDDELFILDVRNEDDYKSWQIEESHNLPIYDELLEEDFTGLKASLSEIPKDKESLSCVLVVSHQLVLRRSSGTGDTTPRR